MHSESPNVANLAIQMAMMALAAGPVPARAQDRVVDSFAEHPIPRRRGPDLVAEAKQKALAAQYREDAAARKALNFRKRLPAGHPDKL